MANLFELQSALWELVMEAHPVDEEEDTDEEIAGWRDRAVEILEGEVEAKLDGLVAVQRTLDHEEKLAREESKRWHKKATALKNRSTRLKEYGAEMIMGLPKITKKGTAKYQTVRGPRWSTWVHMSPPSFDPDLVDIKKASAAELVDFEPKILIRQAVDIFSSTGEAPPGFEDAIREPRWTLRSR